MAAGLLVVLLQQAWAIQTPTGLVSRTGDCSVVLHWDPVSARKLAGYRVYRSTQADGPFRLQTTTPLTSPGFCDLDVLNRKTHYYRVTAITTGSEESAPSIALPATPRNFADDAQFLDYVQETAFDYFWYLANPNNGLIPDRSAAGSVCSIAAVGFGLTAIGLAVDHGWISRGHAAARVLTTLKTFWKAPQGPGPTGVAGYQGWFYHFLDMNTGLRASSELSSVDTAWLLAGMLYARQYFNGDTQTEAEIRKLAEAIFDRVNWAFMAQGSDRIALGWEPTSGFARFGKWTGYNEAMLLYCLALGTTNNPLPSTAWAGWTSGYTWTTNYGYAYVPFPPIFGHQYSACWIDFRQTSDLYMSSHGITYFENSRRATLAQRAYCTFNPEQKVGYSSNVWGLTACDGPNQTVHGTAYAGYAARGAPNGLDDNTIAPTAVAGSMAFAPEAALPTLRHFYKAFRRQIWTAYGFRDAFNQAAHWWDQDELGIDEGAILLSIENYRTQRVWHLFMRNPEIQRGLQRAGFFSVPSLRLISQPLGQG